MSAGATVIDDLAIGGGPVGRIDQPSPGPGSAGLTVETHPTGIEYVLALAAVRPRVADA